MNTTSKKIKSDIEDLDEVLQSALEFNSNDEKLQFETEMLHLNTMYLIEFLMKKNNMNKKDLAIKLNTSQSYITQLFTADKIINYKMLARLQRVFNVSFLIDSQCWSDLDLTEIRNITTKKEAKVVSLTEYNKEKNYIPYIVQPLDIIATG